MKPRNYKSEPAYELVMYDTTTSRIIQNFEDIPEIINRLEQEIKDLEKIQKICYNNIGLCYT